MTTTPFLVRRYQVVAQRLDVHHGSQQVNQCCRGGNGQIAEHEVLEVASPARVITHLQDEKH